MWGGGAFRKERGEDDVGEDVRNTEETKWLVTGVEGIKLELDQDKTSEGKFNYPYQETQWVKQQRLRIGQ